jgi:threonine synthase
MGLPMAKLVVATNSNDILARFWKTGKYEKADSSNVNGVSLASCARPRTSDNKQAAEAGGVKETCSPAMDILVSSNFERLLWYLAYGTTVNEDDNAKRREASKTVSEWMGSMKTDGRVEVPTAVLELAREDFVAERISDDQVRNLPFLATTTI